MCWIHDTFDYTSDAMSCYVGLERRIEGLWFKENYSGYGATIVVNNECALVPVRLERVECAGDYACQGMQFETSGPVTFGVMDCEGSAACDGCTILNKDLPYPTATNPAPCLSIA
eukprot:TRINITY_DN2222_c0_g1_i1.p1 TRINITY_DN2222_c0_g1~~TRINITY_DN2222_c0_g1_i1.p1  ORF type:complete len:115 (+),score=14.92 TRINITY_DN2222_c0_g1_i1:112-456(+)